MRLWNELKYQIQQLLRTCESIRTRMATLAPGTSHERYKLIFIWAPAIYVTVASLFCNSLSTYICIHPIFSLGQHLSTPVETRGKSVVIRCSDGDVSFNWRFAPLKGLLHLTCRRLKLPWIIKEDAEGVR